MICIVGLGNPGEKYKNTRHNVGFQFIDYLVENLQNPKSNFQFPNEFQISHIKIQNNLSSIIYHLSSNLILAKPQTFINNSGLAVKKILSDFQTFKLSNLLVVHDDLDIPLGKFKIQKGTGPKLHNGVQSIEQYLKTKDFWRIRIGVDDRHPKQGNSRLSHLNNGRDQNAPTSGWIDGETYILQDFTKEESVNMIHIFKLITERINKTHLINPP